MNSRINIITLGILDVEYSREFYAKGFGLKDNGRGQVASLRGAVIDQIEYLKVADKIVGSYIDGLGKKVKELSGEKAGAHYEQLMKEFEAQFSGYDLSYMIQYGVYGLVNSKL